MLDFAYFVKLINDDFAKTELPYPFSNLEECAFEDTSAGGVDAYRKAIREEWAPRLDFCELMASRNPAHVASWYYTAALVAYVCDMSARAERLLAKAQRSPQTTEEVLPIRCLAMKMYMKKHGLSSEEVLYMGDDIPDFPVLKACGFPCCPADAASEIKNICCYISPFEGGKGCARDVIEQVMKANGDWMSDNVAFGW